MKTQATIQTQIKDLASEDAATLIMEIFPVESENFSEAFEVMAHRSWKKNDQLRLARFLLEEDPVRQRKALRNICFLNVFANVNFSG